MTDNKESITNSEPSCKSGKSPKEKSPLWARVLTFAFALMVACCIFYSMFVKQTIQGSVCSEKEKQHRDN